MDGEVRPVEKRQKGVGVELVGVGGKELLPLPQEILRPLRLRVATGANEVEVRRRDEEIRGLDAKLDALWDEIRAFRARVRFGDRDKIVARARVEERLERAA